MSNGIAVRSGRASRGAPFVLVLATVLIWCSTAVRAAVLEGTESGTGRTNQVGGATASGDLNPMSAWIEGAAGSAPPLDDAVPLAPDREIRQEEIRVFLTDPVLAGGAAGLLVLGVSSVVLGIRAWRRAEG